MNAHGFTDYPLEFDLNNPHILIEEEIIDMLDERDDSNDNEPGEVDIVQSGDVLVDRA